MVTNPPSASRSTTQGEAEPVKRRGRPSKHGLKREALLEGAAATFNERGIAGTSLADIAERLGLSRASVYYYVNDRAELVFQCYQRACELTAEDLAAAAEAPTGFERTLAFVARALTADRPPTAVLSEINYLQPAHAAVVRVANDRNIATLIGFIIVLAALDHIDAVILPVLIIPVVCLYLLVATLGMLLALLDVYNRDLRRLLSNLLTIWFFLIPIVYVQNQAKGLVPLRYIDPANILVSEFRSILVYQELPPWHTMISGLAICLVIFTLALYVYRRFDDRLPREV